MFPRISCRLMPISSIPCPVNIFSSIGGPIFNFNFHTLLPDHPSLTFQRSISVFPGLDAAVPGNCHLQRQSLQEQLGEKNSSQRIYLAAFLGRGNSSTSFSSAACSAFCSTAFIRHVGQSGWQSRRDHGTSIQHHAPIANFGNLSPTLTKGHLPSGQAAGNFSFTDPGRANHQYIFGIISSCSSPLTAFDDSGCAALPPRNVSPLPGR